MLSEGWPGSARSAADQAGAFAQAAPDVVRIITRCLRKSPAERFQSAAELRAALELARVKGKE
jgi:hypothetical protein